MKKRILALLCVLAMICAMLPMNVFAADLDETAELAEEIELAEEGVVVKSGLELDLAESEPVVGLTVTAVKGTTEDARSLDQLHAGDTVTAVASVDEGVLCGAQIKLSFDAAKFEVTAVSNDLEDASVGVAGWTQKTASSIEEANTNGVVVVAGVFVNDEEDYENLTLEESLSVVTVTFVVKSDAEDGDAAAFALLQEDGDDSVLTYFSDGVATSFENVVFAEDVPATVVSDVALSTVELTGSLTTPVKGAEDASDFTADNVTAVVTWSPELSEGKFAADTVYTATVTVTADEGYVFADGASVTGGDLSFEKSGDAYVATKEFPATAADTTPLTGADITLVETLTYTGESQTQNVTVSLDDVDLTEGVDFEVSDNVQTYAGEYELTVTGIGAYEGTENKIWTIAAAEQTLSAVEDTLELGRGETLSAEQLIANVSGAEGELTFTGSGDAGSVTENVFTATQTAGSVVISVAAAAVDANTDGTADILAAESAELFTVTVRDENPTATGSCGTNATWEYYASGKLVIKGTGAMTTFAALADRPWKDYAGSITSVEVRSGITNVGALAFQACGSLKSVSLADTVAKIERRAFYNCSKLDTLTVSTNCTTIASTAFGGCSALNSVNITGSEKAYEKKVVPGIVTTNNDSFINAAKVYSVVNSGYCGLTNETDIYWEFYPETGTLKLCGSGDMANYASEKVTPWYTAVGASILTDVKNVVFEDGITSVGDFAFYKMKQLTSVTLPSELIKIGASAFNTTGLTSVTIPGKTKTIGTRAFNGASSLETVDIPFSVQTVNARAFDGCSKLKTVNYSGTAAKWNRINIGANNDPLRNADKNVQKVAPTLSEGVDNGIYWRIDADDVLWIEGEGAMKDYARKKAPWYEETREHVIDIRISEGITDIGAYAFYYAAYAASVTLPSTVKTIGEGAFYGCLALTDVSFPDGLVSLGNYAFRKCGKLTSVVLPEGFTTLGSSVFQFASSIKNVYIPDSVKVIEIRNFADCTSMQTLRLSKNLRTVAMAAFRNCTPSTVIYERSQSSFKQITFKGEANGGVKNAAIDFAETESGKINDSFTWTFDNATSTLTVSGNGSMPDFTTSEQFDWYWTLPTVVKKIVVADGITHVGNAMFLGFSKVTSVTLPNTLKSIGSHSFRNLSKLSSVVIPEGCTFIDASAFRGCAALVSITIPASLQSIGNAAFDGCTSLTTVYYTGTGVQFAQISVGSLNNAFKDAALELI